MFSSVKWNTNLMQHCAGFISAESLYIKLVFHLTYTMMHGNTKLKFSVPFTFYSHSLCCCMGCKYTWCSTVKVQTNIVDENEAHFLYVCLFHKSFSFLGNWGKLSRMLFHGKFSHYQSWRASYVKNKTFELLLCTFLLKVINLLFITELRMLTFVCR